METSIELVRAGFKDIFPDYPARCLLIQTVGGQKRLCARRPLIRLVRRGSDFLVSGDVAPRLFELAALEDACLRQAVAGGFEPGHDTGPLLRRVQLELQALELGDLRLNQHGPPGDHRGLALDRAMLAA